MAWWCPKFLSREKTVISSEDEIPIDENTVPLTADDLKAQMKEKINEIYTYFFYLEYRKTKQITRYVTEAVVDLDVDGLPLVLEFNQEVGVAVIRLKKELRDTFVELTKKNYKDDQYSASWGDVLCVAALNDYKFDQGTLNNITLHNNIVYSGMKITLSRAAHWVRYIQDMILELLDKTIEQLEEDKEEYQLISAANAGTLVNFIKKHDHREVENVPVPDIQS